MAASCSVRAALFILLLGQAWGSGTFELRILQFVNGESSLASGGHCVPDCRTFFRVCLKHFQVLVSPGPCTYGTLLSPLMGSGSFRVATTHSPLRLNFTFKWPGTFSLIIEAWNSPPSQLIPNVTSPEMLISRFAIQRRQSVGSSWSRDDQRRQLTQLHYSYRVVCSHHYYGEGCSRYCRPRNDTFGHFTCGALGQRICMDGWANEYCTRPICRSGCSARHGYCHRPGECKCHFGWQGESCNDCMRHPGCLHGTCEQPFQCTCREGWGGLFCNQDLNYCTHNKPCLNSATCTNTGQGSYTCTCPLGFTGVNCQTPVSKCHSSPCRNGGTCTESEEGYRCSCGPAFNGKHCENSVLTCADLPCFNGGTCYQRSRGVAYICHCAPGFAGINCEQRVDDCTRSPCANGGRCEPLGLSWSCRCRPGFVGRSCEVELGGCGSTPCLHGGRCLPGTGRGGAACSCPPGFVGRWCEEVEPQPGPSPSQSQSGPPGPAAWQLVSLGCGLAALALMILGLTLALRRLWARPRSRQPRPRPRPPGAMNNRAPPRDNLVAASQLKLAGLGLGLDVDRRPLCKLTNCAADRGPNSLPSPGRKWHKNQPCLADESWPLTQPSEKLECTISTIACSCELKNQTASQVRESWQNNVTTQV
ncbi:delta-like protein 4 [Amblyraja radiata]|uniref:delta-like protein 4 n=1 Tax=Amblyraja radiata TaxID=386614 RepID=UPI0014032F25|nr:delta-like protein 4 [Amblyraja radiata]